LSMHPIDQSDSEGSSDDKSDSNTESGFNFTQRKKKIKSLEDHAPDWGFLETDGVMVSLQDHTPDVGFVGLDCFMSNHF